MYTYNYSFFPIAIIILIELRLRKKPNTNILICIEKEQAVTLKIMSYVFKYRLTTWNSKECLKIVILRLSFDFIQSYSTESVFFILNHTAWASHTSYTIKMKHVTDDRKKTRRKLQWWWCCYYWFVVFLMIFSLLLQINMWFAPQRNAKKKQ